MNNVILMLKISTVALAVLIVVLIILTVLWIRAELRAKRAEALRAIFFHRREERERQRKEKDNGGER